MKKLTWFLASLALAAPLSAQTYEGFGRAVTGGDASPTCLVNNVLATGAGSFSDCARRGNVHVVFGSAGPYLVDGQQTYINSNTSIDGCANGQNGVTLDQPSDIYRAVVFEGGGSSSGTGNIKIQCIRFQGHGKSAGATTEHDLFAADGTSGPVIGILIDRCTFTGATDGAVDLTGNVSEVTVSHSLFYNNPLTSLLKYGQSADSNSGPVPHDITLHHNVYTQNSERNPQIRGPVTADLVSNVVGPPVAIIDFENGQPFSKFGTLLWASTAAGEGPQGNPKVNLTNSAYFGSFDGGPNVCRGGAIDICIDPNASASGIFLSANQCDGGCAASPASASQFPIPVPSQVLVTPVSGLKATVPAVGSPNKSAADSAVLNAVVTLLGGPTPSPTPSPSPTPGPTPTPVPTPTPSPVPTPTPQPSPTPTPCPVCAGVTMSTAPCNAVVKVVDAHTTTSTLTCVTTTKH